MVRVKVSTERFDNRAYGITLSFIEDCIELAIDLGRRRLWIDIWKR